MKVLYEKTFQGITTPPLLRVIIDFMELSIGSTIMLLDLRFVHYALCLSL